MEYYITNQSEIFRLEHRNPLRSTTIYEGKTNRPYIYKKFFVSRGTEDFFFLGDKKMKELNRLSEMINRFTLKDSNDLETTKEGLQAEYAALLEIFESIELPELKLLWFLRNTRLGDTNTFYRIAKANYLALKGLKGLLDGDACEVFKKL